MKNHTWPTPTTQEIEHPNAELTATGRRKSKDGKSSHSLNLADQVNMWPTPNASDNRDRGNMSDPAIQRRIKKGKQVGLTMAVKDKPGIGTLNPDWVEWLMGYAPGYTDPEYNEPMQLEDHLGFESEPDIPRVTTRKEHRVNRLKCLGNSIVPQIMFHIGNAILEDDRKK